MYVQERLYSHFLDLVENKRFAKSYFHNKDINEFNNQKLDELKSNLKMVQFEYDKVSLLLSVIQFLNMKKKISDVALKVENVHERLRTCINDLDIFESNLAFLLITDVIKLDDCGSLGFDSEYIKQLIYCYKKKIENPYIEYYYDEKTGRTARVTETGKMIILPYTPIAVKDKISEAKANANGGKRLFRG